METIEPRRKYESVADYIKRMESTLGLSYNVSKDMKEVSEHNRTINEKIYGKGDEFDYFFEDASEESEDK